MNFHMTFDQILHFYQVEQVNTVLLLFILVGPKKLLLKMKLRYLGYVLSRETLRLLVEQGLKHDLCPHRSFQGVEDDVTISLYL